MMRKGSRGPGFEGPRVAESDKQTAASQPPGILAPQYNIFDVCYKPSTTGNQQLTAYGLKLIADPYRNLQI